MRCIDENRVIDYNIENMFNTNIKRSVSGKIGVAVWAILSFVLFLAVLFSYAGAYDDTSAYAFDAVVHSGTDFAVGDGSEANPYRIQTKADLLLLSDLTNRACMRSSDKALYSSLSYRLEADLDLTDEAFSPIGIGDDVFRHYFPVLPDGKLEALRESHWTDEYKIYFYVFYEGAYVSAVDYNGGVHDDNVLYYFLYDLTNGFYGHFDGNGHTIRGLDLTGTDFCGLFGYAENALIENLTVADSSFVSTGKTGAIAGQIVGSQVLSCNVIGCTLSNGAGDAVGGGVGSAYKKNKYVIYMDGWNCGEIVYEGLYADIGEPYDTIISRIFADELTVSGENALGGIVGNGEEFMLSHSFSGVVVPQGSASGTLIGDGEHALADDCVAVSGSLIGNIDNGAPFLNIYYPSDLFTDEIFSCEWTTNDLLTTPVSAYFSLPGSGTYYPSPTSLYKEASVYDVSFDHTHAVYVNVLDEHEYVLPAAAEKNGYTFAYYLCDGEAYAEGDGIALASSVDFLPYYTLNAPSETDMQKTLSPTYEFVYEAAERTVAEVTYTHPYGFTSTVSWYRRGETDTLVTVSDALTLTNVSDSGSHFARVTVVWDHAVHLAGAETASVDTSLTEITILPVSVTVTTQALLDGENRAVFTGNTFSPVFSYETDAEIYASDLPLLSVTYETRLSDETVPSIASVGTYEISADLTGSSNYAFTYESAFFTVTPAVITPVVTPYNGVYDGQPHFPSYRFDMVDGSVCSVLFSSDNRTFYSSYESLMQTDVVANFPVWFSVSAPNHETLSYSSSVTVTPCKITLTLRDDHPVVSKVYDGSSSYSGIITSDYYRATYGSGYEGVGVTFSTATFSSPRAGETYLNAVFAPINGNFALSDSILSIPASITQAIISVLPKRTVTATYNGSTNFYESIGEDDYTIQVENSTALPSVSVYSATADSKNVSEATTLRVVFSLSGNNFRWKESGVVIFSFRLLPRRLRVDTSKIIPADRAYDGTTNVALSIVDNPLSGYIAGETPTLALEDGQIPSPDASETPYAVSIENYSLSNDNYTIDPDVFLGAFTVTISQAEPVFAVQTDASVLYDSATDLPAIRLVSCSTSGTLAWKYVFKIGTVIDFNRYLTAENEVSFRYAFTPDDLVNYRVVESTMRFAFERKASVDFHVTFTGRTEYTAFETFDRTGLTATLSYNDGSTENVTSRSYVSYENGNTFLGTDTFVNILFADGETLYLDTIAVTIQKAGLPLPYSPMEYTYNGNPYVMIPANYRANLMTISGNNGTNAAAYEAVVTLREEALDNYRFVGGETTARVAWEIKPLQKYVLFLEDTVFVYGGQPVSVQLRNDYNADSAFFTATGDLTATDAGTYDVIVSLNSGNYIWRETGSSDPLRFTWTIRPKALSKPEIYDLPFRFDGREHTVQTDTDEGYTLSGDTTYLHAGSYSIQASLISENNYVWVDGTKETVTLSYTVSPIEVVKPTYKEAFTFNGSNQSIRVFDTDYYTVSGTTFATNANDYAATVRLRSEDYVWIDGGRDDLQISWYILSRSIPVPVSGGSVGYTGWEQTALITYDRTYCSASGVTGIGAGTYVAIIRLLDKHNTYWADNTTEDKTFRWNIDRAIVNIPRAPENVLYNGLTQVAFLPESTQYTVQGNQQKDVGTYEITVSLNDKFNYVWEDETVSDKKYVWKICSLTLSSDGTAESLTTYSLGTPLAQPYRSGYVFGGWYLSSDFSGEAVTSLSSIDQNTVLYAKWTEEKTYAPTNGSTRKESALGTKAIVGLAVAGGALVISILIVLLGIVLKRR